MSDKFLRFVIVGGGCALLYFVVMWFCRASLGLTPFLATICAYGVSFCVAYTLQHRWTFRSASAYRETLPRYALVQVICALLTAGITQAISHFQPQAPGWLLAGISTVLASGLSFVLSSQWVFSASEK
ncbi:MAG: GtrA family protein [Rhodanobacter sp.]|nr:MAG: GtrA family protein [Rhodanobacter sp.]